MKYQSMNCKQKNKELNNSNNSTKLVNWNKNHRAN